MSTAVIMIDDYWKLENKYNQTKKALRALADLDQNERIKLGINNGILYKNWSFASGIQRSLWYDSRKNLVEYLSLHFANAIECYKVFLSLAKNKTFIHMVANQLAGIRKDFNSWTTGLQSLQTTYSDHDTTVSSLSGFVHTLTRATSFSIDDVN